MICNVFLLRVAGRDPPASVVPLAWTPRRQWSRWPLGPLQVQVVQVVVLHKIVHNLERPQVQVIHHP